MFQTNKDHVQLSLMKFHSGWIAPFHPELENTRNIAVRSDLCHYKALHGSGYIFTNIGSIELVLCNPESPNHGTCEEQKKSYSIANPSRREMDAGTQAQFRKIDTCCPKRSSSIPRYKQYIPTQQQPCPAVTDEVPQWVDRSFPSGT
jgi:hypothetical protein